MLGRDIVFGLDARNKILEGVSLLEKSVITTLGPKGRNVLIDKGTVKPVITKDGVTVPGRVAVVGSVCIALILSLFNIIAQKRLRCPIWIILIGLYVAIKEILLPLIIILAFVTVIDDLILTPLITYYRTKLISNKAIDERLAQDGDIEQKG